MDPNKTYIQSVKEVEQDKTTQLEILQRMKAKAWN